MMGALICTSKGRWEHSKVCGKMNFYFGWWQGCQVDLEEHKGDDQCKLQEFMAFQDVQLDYPICFY
jgi:hypothetical protein